MKEGYQAVGKAFELTQKEKEDKRRHQEAMARLQRESVATFTYVEKEGKVYAINNKNPDDIREVKGDLAGAKKFAAPAGRGGAAQVGAAPLERETA
jgi:hypothetical protein